MVFTVTGRGEGYFCGEEVPKLDNNNKDYSDIFTEETIPLIKLMSEGMPGGFFIYHADGDEELIHINSSMLRTGTSEGY